MGETEFVDYYKILEIDPNASQQEIKMKYLTLAKTHHPDKGGDEKVFQTITRAYECLSKKESRFDYDQIYLRVKTALELTDLNNISDISNMDFVRLRDEFINFSKKLSDIPKSDENVLIPHEKITPIDETDLKNNLENLKLEREMLDIENDNNQIQEYIKQNPNTNVSDLFQKMNVKHSTSMTIFDSDPSTLYGRWDSSSKDLVSFNDSHDNNLTFGEFAVDYNNINNLDPINDNRLNEDDLEKFLKLREKELDDLLKAKTN